MFDPYHKWLGIRKEQRPPTHYQLLGISPDETDVEVIEEAAIRQMAHIRTYQIGPHAKECTQILNEISQARTTLLNAGKRKDYDAQLAAKAAEKLAQEQPIAEQAVAAQITATPPAPAAAPALEFAGLGDRQDEVVAPPHRAPEAKDKPPAMPSIAKEGVFLTKPMLLGIIGGGAALAVVVVLVVVVLVFGLTWWGTRPPAGPVAGIKADKKDGKDRDGKVKPPDGPVVVGKDNKEKIVVKDGDKGNFGDKVDNPKPPIKVVLKDEGNVEANTQALLKRIAAARKGGLTNQTQLLGTGRDPYEEVPDPAGLLVGFTVVYGKFGDNPTIGTVRPIFITAAGKVMGQAHGPDGKPDAKIEAPPGYAVGGVNLKPGLGVDGMSLTYMQIKANGLDPDRPIESAWVGGLGGGVKTMLAGTGAPVIGIFGKTAPPGSTFNGLGVVTAATERIDLAAIVDPKIKAKPRAGAPMGFEEEVTQAGELKIRQLARAAYGAPVWDTDGRHFYFSARTTELFKMRADDHSVAAYKDSHQPPYFYVSLALSSEGLLGLSKRIGNPVEGAVLVLLEPNNLLEKRNVVVTATKCQPLLVASAPTASIAVVGTTDGLYVVNVKTSDVSIPVNLPMKLFGSAAYITPDGKYFFGTEGTALVRCRIEGDKLIHEETSKPLSIQPGSDLRIEGSVDGKRVWLTRAVQFNNPVSRSMEIFAVGDLSKSVQTVAGESSFYSLMLSPRDGTPYGSLKESPLVRFAGPGKVNQTFTIKLDEPRQIYASPSGEGFLVRGRDTLFHAAFSNVGVAVQPPGAAIDVVFGPGGRYVTQLELGPDLPKDPVRPQLGVHRAYNIPMEAGRTYTVTLARGTPTVNPLVFVYDPDGKPTNSGVIGDSIGRIEVKATRTGVYRLNTVALPVAGKMWRLTIHHDGPGGVDPGDPARIVVPADGRFQAEYAITDADPITKEGPGRAKYFVVRLDAGSRYEIRMTHLEDTMIPYLVVYHPVNQYHGYMQYFKNDGARDFATPKESADYRILATSLEDSRGRFSLRITRMPAKNP